MALNITGLTNDDLFYYKNKPRIDQVALTFRQTATATGRFAAHARVTRARSTLTLAPLSICHELHLAQVFTIGESKLGYGYILFRDHETGYLTLSVILVLFFICLAAWYEIDYRDTDSPLETAAAIIQWISAAIALTITILATWEVVMIFAERYRARRFEEGREKGRKESNAEWKAWLQRREEAQANNQPFNEPNPSEKE